MVGGGKENMAPAKVRKSRRLRRRKRFGAVLIKNVWMPENARIDTHANPEPALEPAIYLGTREFTVRVHVFRRKFTYIWQHELRSNDSSENSSSQKRPRAADLSFPAKPPRSTTHSISECNIHSTISLSFNDFAPETNVSLIDLSYFRLKYSTRHVLTTHTVFDRQVDK